MRIGIISDTHIRKDYSKIDSFIEKYLKDLDAIIHVGDYTTIDLIDKLKKTNDFVGVYGNVDGLEIKDMLKQKEFIEILGHKIGIFHGDGNRKTTIERVYDEFKNDDVDILVFGHSHQPIIKTKNQRLMLNPGSPTDKRRERWFSYIVLELTEELINAQLRFFS
ncbi:metallophosphoesterase family protein [Sporosalibacterium faouarense]|uniref:metallophosphoesterase family protein n=1 Tax=Sporosalibacterium faouarense TaxID=516123 RepID=UPI00141CF2E5|nr:metallophosphoesterase family protein [Sporosalibacterium faouarense]MTI46999.1 metallophosphoesterase family protein [Bacillota bacterium]